MLTAAGGAGLVLAGLGRTTDQLAWLRSPDEVYLAVVDVVLWLALAALGWMSQRRITAGRRGERSSGT